MDMKAIDKAIFEAERFLDVAKMLKDRHANDKDFRNFFGITGFKETGALRRTSLDLSRALSAMRKR